MRKMVLHADEMVDGSRGRLCRVLLLEDVMAAGLAAVVMAIDADRDGTTMEFRPLRLSRERHNNA